MNEDSGTGSGSGTTGSSGQWSAAIAGAWLWRPGQAPAELTPGAESPADGVRWFDLGQVADTDAVLELLGPLCEGLTREIVEDLLTPDNLPDGRSCASGRIRLASTFAIEPIGIDPHGVSRAEAPEPGAFLYQPVELVAADDWLLSCWHPPHVYRGAEESESGSDLHRRDEVDAAVAKRWTDGAGSTAADLGVLIMAELSLSYSPAQRAMTAALENWELELYTSAEGIDPEPLELELRRLWGARAMMRDWLNPLNIPGVGSDIDRAWLPAKDTDSVAEVNRRVDRALNGLAALGEPLRASFHVIQSKRAEHQRIEADQLRHRIELLAALFLIPTFVVGFYGANTWVPGQGEHWGFWVMVLVIITMTTIGLLALVRLHKLRLDNLRLHKLNAAMSRFGTGRLPSFRDKDQGD